MSMVCIRMFVYGSKKEKKLLCVYWSFVTVWLLVSIWILIGFMAD